jgi:citrate lyase synthetase
MSIIFAFYVSIACNLAVFAMFLYTRGRVAKFFQQTQALDWQSVADITGDIGALKRSIQRLNNRLNGMEKTANTPDALAELALIHKQNQNVTPIQAAPPRATGG